MSAELLQQHMEKLQAVDTDGEDGYKREFQVNQILMSKSNKYVWHPMLGELLAGALRKKVIISSDEVGSCKRCLSSRTTTRVKSRVFYDCNLSIAFSEESSLIFSPIVCYWKKKQRWLLL